MNRYGLIGFPLTHSFSQRYFTEKFAREGITDSRYDLFDLPDIAALPDLLTLPGLRGLNVTIPHKQTVFPYLHRIDEAARKIGAVNVIKFENDGTRTGYNSDYYGFRQSLTDWLLSLKREAVGLRALILGTGGASKAIVVALADMGIPCTFVSRTPSANAITYAVAGGNLNQYQLVVNASPIGTYPLVNNAPDIPYHQLTDRHLLYDLVYNPSETQFMKLGREQGACVHNGLRMLELQAEKSWEIWQS